MKLTKILAACAIVVATAASCCSVPSVEKQPAGLSKADVDSASYALGVYFGQAIVQNKLGDMNMSQVMKGLRDALNDYKNETNAIEPMFVGQRMNSFMQKREEALAAVNLKAGTDFLVKNHNAPGVVTLEDGLQYLVVREGNGVKPTCAQDTVEVNYEGSTLDGKVFDSSYERGETITFPLDRVIPGWTEGLQYADEGGEITLWIPCELGYGKNGPMGPNQLLKFKVELVKVMPYQPKEEAESAE
ncbi:MAG: FKBP-type peptidyl-prolyl cis-trans isomerase [Bacteroidales bacterium]|nr:FKBP-type peptidyl-prolyl cis-trans isomerase [Bacteroidales bacterium]